MVSTFLFIESSQLEMAHKSEHGGTDKMMELLWQMEAAADDILTNRQQIIDLDRKRQKTREAVRYT